MVVILSSDSLWSIYFKIVFRPQWPETPSLSSLKNSACHMAVMVSLFPFLLYQEQSEEFFPLRFFPE